MDVNNERLPSVFNKQHGQCTGFLENRDLSKQHLYVHQVDAVVAARDHLQRSKVALVVLPTGCGKTGVAVLAAYALDANRVLVITPSVTISEQIHEAFCGSQTNDKFKPCFLVEREIVKRDEEHLVCPAGVWIKKASDIPYHRHDQFMVVNAHKIGGRSSVKIEDIPNDRYDLVIVNEAHHYPAPTWKLLVDHFAYSRRLFLTATPLPPGGVFPYHALCFQLTKRQAIERGIIRDIIFCEVPGHPYMEDMAVMQSVAREVRWQLDQHDLQDPRVQHQAMVLTQTVLTRNPAEDFRVAYNAVIKEAGAVEEACEMYVSGSSPEVLRKFKGGNTRTLIIVGRLLEGYDNNRVSVVAIVRNVAPESRVLFAQFVGRAVRKAHPADPVNTVVVSHGKYHQRANFDQFDQVAERDYDYDP